MITDALKAVGCKTQSLAAVGDGCPDLLVMIPGGIWPKLVLFEIKDPKQAPNKRRLRKSQIDWQANWAPGKVHLVETVEQALSVIAYYRGRLIRVTS